MHNVMNIQVQVLMWTSIFISVGSTLWTGIARSFGNLIFNFLIANFFPKQLQCFTFQMAMYEDCSFSTPLSTLIKSCYFFKLYYSHFSGCEVASYCGFDLHFPNHK